jgi:hypothetical protein
MTLRPEYTDGAPCWADLMTPDREGAERFYGGLFGWTFDPPNPGFNGYAMVRRNGQSVAGMMQIVPGRGMQVAWNTHFSASDAAATVRTIVAAGGTVPQGPHPVGSLGVMMFAADPTGGYFGVWQPGEHRGAEWAYRPGGMCWHELYTRDGARADAFYRAVFDYAQAKVPNDKGVDYANYGRGGRPLCGRLEMTAAWGGVPPHWLTYFAVEDLEASLAKSRALAGESIHGPYPTPLGPSALVRDPYGAVFGLTQLSGPSA